MMNPSARARATVAAWRIRHQITDIELLAEMTRDLTRAFADVEDQAREKQLDLDVRRVMDAPELYGDEHATRLRRAFQAEKPTRPQVGRSLPCGNCGLHRIIEEGYRVEKCKHCGDDEFSLAEETGP